MPFIVVFTQHKEMYKSGEIIGEILRHLPGGEVEVNYGGTLLTLLETDNEFLYIKLYHASRIKPFKMEQPGNSFLATEGNGIYASVDKGRHAASFGGNQVELIIKRPAKLITADRQYFNDAFLNGDSESLEILQQPISRADSTWLQINKQAIAETGYLNKGTESTEDDLANLNAVLTRILIENGYDAVFVHPTSDIEGGDFYVILDTSLVVNHPAIQLKAGGGLNLLAPNGKPSNLTPEQYRVVRTTAFKAWFGDWEYRPETASKVVDENGEPLVVYHGTPPNFYPFNEFQLYNEGIFFAESREVAHRYATSYSGDFGVVKAVFLNIKKPEIIKSVKYTHDGYSGADANLKKRAEKYKSKHPEFINAPYKFKELVRVTSEKKGHDGFFLENHSWGAAIDSSKQFAVFSTTQIKLADGTNTTFNGSNPDIRFGQGGAIPERYRRMGFEKIGEKKQSTSAEKKWMVLAKKGDLYKIVHGGQKGMQDFSQHHNEERRKKFWQRMGGENSPKAKDPFSPLYWHKKFKTWEHGGVLDDHTIKVAWPDSENTEVLESRMFTDLDKAKKFAEEKTGGNYFIMELTSQHKDNYKWKLLPYGMHLKYKAAVFLNKFMPPFFSDGGILSLDSGGKITDDDSFESNFSIGGKYWGSSAAGVLLIAKNTGRCLFMHRSAAVLEPHTWGIISGKIDKDETPEQAVYREAIEEIGDSHSKILSIRPSYVFHATDDEFVFYNFIGVVEEEFEPTLNWESIGHKWATPNDLPDPLHPGVKKFLSEINLKLKIKQSLQQYLAPNGKPSKLTPEQYRLVRTPDFKAWFGDWENNPDSASKVVDENGEPAICFHGTNEAFNLFRNDVGHSNDAGFYGYGFYFTFGNGKYSESEAAYYGRLVKSYFIKSSKPFDFSELSNYKGVAIRFLGTQSLVFLANVAEMFPDIASGITTWQNLPNNSDKYQETGDWYETKSVPISILPDLISKYQKELKIVITKSSTGEKKSGYVRSKIEFYDYTSTGGTKGSYEDIEWLGEYDMATNDTEVEILLIEAAISKYNGISPDFHPEGYMTRHPEITEAIKKNHDSIMQSKFGDELVVFTPTQIKLADGTNTAFDASNPDVRFEAGGEMNELSESSKWFIKVMHARKLARMILHKSNPKYKEQMAGIQDAIDKGYLYVKTYQRNEDSVFVRPTSKLISLYFPEKTSVGFSDGGTAGGKTITVKVPISSSLAWNAGMEALGDLSKLSEEDFIKTWKYVIATNYMWRSNIDVSDYVHTRHHHILHQAGAQHNVDAVNAEFKRRELDKKYSLFIERKTTDALPKPQKQTAIKSFEEIMLLSDLDSQRSALTKYILENPSVKIPVAFSGGKDSIAMVLHLLELGVPKSQMELWHHDVDGHGEELFDWHVTPEYCQAFADAIGIKLLFSYRAGGIVKRLLRNNEPRGDVYYQTPDYQWHMTPSDHSALNTGGRWPSKGNDMNARWCSSEVKIDVASQILSNDPRLQGTREKPMEILLCTGERHLESDKRATYAELQVYKKGSFTANRKVLSWRPIIEYSEEMVWELLKKWNIQPHPCYYLGWGRCSCQLCIFNEAPYWAASYEISPEKIIRIRQLEIITARYPKNEGKEHTLYDKMDIFEKSTLEKPVINLGTEEAKFWIKQATEQFTLPIFVQGEWKLPSGAFKKENCGAS